MYRLIYTCTRHTRAHTNSSQSYTRTHKPTKLTHTPAPQHSLLMHLTHTQFIPSKHTHTSSPPSPQTLLSIHIDTHTQQPPLPPTHHTQSSTPTYTRSPSLHAHTHTQTSCKSRAGLFPSPNWCEKFLFSPSPFATRVSCSSPMNDFLCWLWGFNSGC